MFGSTINIKVENAGASAGSWTAFSLNRGGASPSGGASITVNASPNSMDFAARESSTHPYVTKKIKVKVTADAQFSNNITITGTVGTEQRIVNIDPLNYYNPNTGIDGLIEIPLPPFVIDGTLGLSGTIDGSTTMNIVIEHGYVPVPLDPGHTASKLIGGDVPVFRPLTTAEKKKMVECVFHGRVDIENPKN